MRPGPQEGDAPELPFRVQDHHDAKRGDGPRQPLLPVLRRHVREPGIGRWLQHLPDPTRAIPRRVQATGHGPELAVQVPREDLCLVHRHAPRPDLLLRQPLRGDRRGRPRGDRLLRRLRQSDQEERPEGAEHRLLARLRPRAVPEALPGEVLPGLQERPRDEPRGRHHLLAPRRKLRAVHALGGEQAPDRLPEHPARVRKERRRRRLAEALFAQRERHAVARMGPEPAAAALARGDRRREQPVRRRVHQVFHRDRARVPAVLVRPKRALQPDGARSAGRAIPRQPRLPAIQRGRGDEASYHGRDVQRGQQSQAGREDRAEARPDAEQVQGVHLGADRVPPGDRPSALPGEHDQLLRVLPRGDPDLLPLQAPDVEVARRVRAHVGEDLRPPFPPGVPQAERAEESELRNQRVL
mmetsp:Transcript_11881/g.29268  ORF Transcript_11881/g.29268 Transcript_11881/m.29268 type:complete len:412 (+) Transcript_11881:1549-2784(+)